MTLSRRTLLLGSAAPALAQRRGWAQDVADSVNVVRAVDAKYEMRVLSSGAVYGHEWWTLFVHPDGSRTLSVRMINNDFDLFRTIVHRVDHRFRPLECQLVYYRHGERMGSAWFRVEGETMTADAESPSGTVGHRVAVPEQFSMVNHAASAEGWHFWYCPKDGKTHQATLYNLRVDATTPEGVLGRVHTRPVQFLENTRTGTPAGEFLCDRYAFGDASRIWVHGEDRMPARLRFEAMDREFVLAQRNILG